MATSNLRTFAEMYISYNFRDKFVKLLKWIVECDFWSCRQNCSAYAFYSPSFHVSSDVLKANYFCLGA